MIDKDHNEIQFDALSTEIECIIHTTTTQLEIWTDCLIGGSGANNAYNLSYSLKFECEFVLEAFEQSLHILVLHHESLRASFSSDGNFMNIYIYKLPAFIDRQKLLQYESNTKATKECNLPRITEEKLVAEVWKESLKKEQIDSFSNFFEIGGHSIMAVNVMIKIEKITGVRIPSSALFQYSTIQKCAKIFNIEDKMVSEHLVPMKPNESKTPLFSVHGEGLNILNFAHLINHFDEDQPIYDFQGGPNSYENWFESIEAMASEYIKSIIKVDPNDPYALAGFSFGGIVAFEIAKQLKESGKIVSTNILLDKHLDSLHYYASYSLKKAIQYLDRSYRRLDYVKEIVTNWKSIKIRLNSRKLYLQKKYFSSKDSLIEQEVIPLKKFEEASAMINKIVGSYHLITQDFQVELLRAKDNQNYKFDAVHLG